MVSVAIPWQDKGRTAFGLRLIGQWTPKHNLEQLLEFVHRDEWRRLRTIFGTEGTSQPSFVFDVTSDSIQALRCAADILINDVGTAADDDRLLVYQAMTRTRQAMEQALAG